MELQLLPYTPERDAYRLLQVDPRANADEIISACRRLARTFHPDRNASPRAHQEMQVVNVVRSVLTDPATRAEYDIARLRFLTQTYRSPAATSAWVRPLSGPMRPVAPASPILKNVLAVWRGLRITVAALAPPRCARCRMVIDHEGAYCALCGNRLLTTSG